MTVLATVEVGINESGRLEASLGVLGDTERLSPDSASQIAASLATLASTFLTLESRISSKCACASSHQGGHPQPSGEGMPDMSAKEPSEQHEAPFRAIAEDRLRRIAELNESLARASEAASSRRRVP